METWQITLLTIAILLPVTAVIFLILLKRSGMTPAEGAAELMALGVEMARLPGRLRRVAADTRTPRRTRWWLIGLAVYIASPIDPIPDFIPVIGYLDELVIVPIVLRKIRQMIPPEVWREHFPDRPNRGSTPEERCSGGQSG